VKVMLPRHWERNLTCCECRSYLRIDTGDLRMTSDHKMHFRCEVCDTKNDVEEVPEYVSRKLHELLEEKRH
jgi:alpha-D-ribose 1-methylphosphonate 5-triphosphate diphosphatase PhnM